jgi:hypothetical protein
MSGLWGLQVLAAGNHIVDTIQGFINSGGGGILKPVNNFLFGLVRDIYNSVVGFLGPSVPGSFGWLEAAPAWLDQMFTTTWKTLANHRARILWLQNTYIRSLHLLLTSDINNAYANAIGYTDRTATSLGNSLVSLFNRVEGDLSKLHTTVEHDISVAHQDALNWATLGDNGLARAINDLFANTTTRLGQTLATAKGYTDQKISSVETKIALLGLSTAAALAAAVSFLTSTVIPGEVAAGVAALNAEAAVAMDLQWEIVATTGNKALAELTLKDLNPMWATNVLSEIPAVTLATADADMTAALKLLMNYVNGAGVPMYRNLKQFGEDTSELDGVITTVLLGAFGVAAVTEPDATATLVVDTLGTPLNEVLTGALSLFGLG